jgi:DNA-directed RNA polymerase subunit beta'
MLMFTSNNLLSPATGRPIATPSQDIVLGCYNLTKDRAAGKGEGMRFSSREEAIMAQNFGEISLHAPIEIRMDGQRIKTTCGRVIFNEILPKEIGYFNEVATKSKLESLFLKVFRVAGAHRCAEFLDDLKNMGFLYATKAGVTVAISDMIIPEEKHELINDTQK